MKKTLLSASAFALVAVSSMALAPTKAEAIPAFARQTGAACLSCHFQQFPALNAYGRMFKEGSFTDVGDEALVEGENLSIPAVLNATFVVRAQAVHTSNGTLPANTTAATSSTTYTIPADQNLLIAGRAGSNTGVFIEFGGGVGDTTGGGINNIQVMNSFDLGGFKAGISYSDTSFGADATLAVNSVYGQHSGVMNNFGDISAVNNSGFTNSMSTIGAWLGNDMGFVQVALVAPGGSAGWGATNPISATQGATNIGLKFAKLIKVAGTFDLGGFDTIVGAGTIGGKVGKPAAGNTASNMDMQWIYGQMQGNIGDMGLGVYADWAHAKGKAGGNLLGAQDATTNTPLAATNMWTGYNSLNNGDKFDAYSIRTTLTPTRRTMVGLGYGYRKTSIAAGGAATTGSVKHQVFELGASYMIYQNNILSLTYVNDKQTVTGGAASLAGGATGNLKTTSLDYLIML